MFTHALHNTQQRGMTDLKEMSRTRHQVAGADLGSRKVPSNLSDNGLAPLKDIARGYASDKG